VVARYHIDPAEEFERSGQAAAMVNCRRKRPYQGRLPRR
jgi:hypothetical protein